MQSSQAPQIIVIPQSMFQSKSLLKISPQISPYRVISSTSTPQPSQNKTILTSNTISPKPVATVIGNKRPASSVFSVIKKELELEEEPTRKRANLDHLTSEERLMRRKLKNRVAAQTARDKKKTQTDDMERIISELQADKKSLMEENSRLQCSNTQLQVENVSLQEENMDLKSRLCQDTVKQRDNIGKLSELQLELPLSPISLPPLSPTSLPPTSPASLPPPLEPINSLNHSSSISLGPTPIVSQPLISPLSTTRLFSTSPASQQPPESAVLTYEPQQQEQGCSGLVRSNLLPGLSSQDLTPLVKMDQMDCLKVIWCALCLLIRTKSYPPPPSSPSPAKSVTHPSSHLPPKKRSKDWTSWTLTSSSTSQPPE